MELSDEDRDRIYAEETARLEIRKKLSDDPKKRKYNKMIKIFLLIIVALFAIAILTDKSTYTPKHRNIGNEACFAARDFVKRTLKAPATADFAPLSESSYATNYKDKTVYTVNSYVDAQNSFGAKIRNYYTVNMKYDAAKDEWSLLDVKFK